VNLEWLFIALAVMCTALSIEGAVVGYARESRLSEGRAATLESGQTKLEARVTALEKALSKAK